jgi:signal transduction histidine kinase
MIVDLLRRNGLEAEHCEDAGFLAQSLLRHADMTDDGPPCGALIVAEEALTPSVIHLLAKVVHRQPAWSDFPILILTSGGRSTLRSRQLEGERAALGSAVLLERPIRTETLVSSVRAAVRSRERQYQVRDTLEERDRILDELRTERETLRVMLDSLPIGVMLARASGEVVRANAAVERILRHPVLPTPDIAAHGEWVSYHPDGSRLKAEEYPLVRALRTGKVIEPEEVLYERGDGTRGWIGLSASPIFNSEGKVVAGVVAVSDLDDRKRAEAALVQSEKLAAVGRLAASISHEINNPLEAVTNLLYLIRQEDSMPDQAMTYLLLAERELARVSQIAGQTLRFHRQSTRPREITPEELIESVVALYQGRLINADIKMVHEHRGAGTVTCYEGDIRQVLNNLVGNAIDSMRTGGKLILRTHKAKLRRPELHGARPVPGIRITVADTGYGMSAETRARIFEAFYTTKGIHGTGLGLWISHGIIEKHHGRLDVRSSNRPGRSGTVFSIFLPAELTPAA